MAALTAVRYSIPFPEAVLDSFAAVHINIGLSDWAEIKMIPL